MAKKEIAVMGLGKFGFSLSKYLSENGYNVIAVDSKEDRVSEISDYVTFAATADVSEADTLKELGISNVDIVVICIGTIESSILATVGCKELKVPKIIAKATNDVHARILRKVGADITLIPEAEMGIRLAKNIMGGMFLDLFEISDKFSLVEIAIPQEWIGHTVADLKIREKSHINIVAIKKNNEEVTVSILPSTIFEENDIVVAVGNNVDLQKFNEK